MNLALARFQFASTSIFHFWLVPITLGMSILVAVMHTMYVRTNDEHYKKMTKFWGNLFLINFAVGVVTGIVQEFQFGMNWSEYSRFVGDIFGVPLAIEALLAFFMESTFLGIWVFGWDRINKKLHLASIWLVAIGSNLSALWILVANSFMQRPVGYTLKGGRAELTDFLAVLENNHVWVQFPHIIFAGLATGGFLILGVSAYHLLRKNQTDFFRRAAKFAAGMTFVASLMIFVVGHLQGQWVAKYQPMKLAAMEAVWDTEDPAAMSIFAIIDQENKKNTVDIKIPNLLSLMIHDSLSGEVRGINDIQKEYEAKYGEGKNYTPHVFTTYWSFKLMVGIGTFMILVGLVAWFFARSGTLENRPWFLRLLLIMIPIPVIASSTGWIVAESGRMPWIVYGLMRVEDAVSPNVSAAALTFTLIGYYAIYVTLIGIMIGLMIKYAKKGVTE